MCLGTMQRERERESVCVREGGRKRERERERERERIRRREGYQVSFRAYIMPCAGGSILGWRLDRSAL